MAAPGVTICIMYANSNQAHKGLMTVAKQPGWEDGRHPFTTPYIIMNSADSIDAYLNSLQVTGKIITLRTKIFSILATM